MHPDLSIPGLGSALTAVSAPRQDFSIVREEAAPCSFKRLSGCSQQFGIWVWQLTQIVRYLPTQVEDENQQREMFTKKSGKMKQDQ